VVWFDCSPQGTGPKRRMQTQSALPYDDNIRMGNANKG
jgi:hypothetical protein